MRFFPASARPLAKVVGQDTKVPLLSGRRQVYINLDNAASTPALEAVWRRVCAAGTWYAGVHRGTGFKGYLSTALYEKARETILNFFGADSKLDTAIFVKNTTEALNKLAAGFPLGSDSVIVTTGMEHHSNDLPWRKRATTYHVQVTADGRLDLDHLQTLLRRLGSKVAVVAVTGASNVTGFVNDIHSIAQMAHAVGARIVVDAAQLAPHRPIRMLSHGHPKHIDFLALSGHKVYAPLGSGVLIGPKTHFPDQPTQPGGGTVTLVTQKAVQWDQLPAREEAGSPNVLGAISLAAAIQELARLGMQKVSAHETRLTDQMLAGLREMSHVSVYGIPDRKVHDRVGVVTFNVAGLPHGLVGAYLAYECGIGVRTGCFCAQPYIQTLLGLTDEQVAKAHEVAHRHGQPLPGMVRASVGLYNTERDITALLQALAPLHSKEKQQELRTRYSYCPADRCYLPAGDNSCWEKYARRTFRELARPLS